MCWNEKNWKRRDLLSPRDCQRTSLDFGEIRWTYVDSYSDN
jgi:hypothetical protein